MAEHALQTITKEEISTLPVEEFAGRIIVIQTKAEADKAVEYLMKYDLVGFDTETRPSFKKGQYYKVSLIQISTDDTCFLFRLNYIGFPESLKQFVSSPEVTKIGLSLRDDFGALRKRSSVEPVNFIDLQSIVGSYGIRRRPACRKYMQFCLRRKYQRGSACRTGRPTC